MTTSQTLTRPASLSEYHERLQKMQAPLMAESTRRGLMYQPQPSDLFITPFAKCGTTWLQQIVHGLRTRGDMDFDDISRVIPWLEMAHRQELDLYAPQRGGFQAFKCHLSWRKIPKGGRYLVSFRDPKDALVSMYAMLDGWHWQAGAISITDYARHFYLRAQGDGWNGSYWGHLVSWWDQRYNPNVLLLAYEGMKADLPATVQTIDGVDDAVMFLLDAAPGAVQRPAAVHASQYSLPARSPFLTQAIRTVDIFPCGNLFQWPAS